MRISNTKKAQSEMVGFALIVIIIAVIIIIFLAIQMNKTKDDSQNSYELESFVFSSLEYTTNCSSRQEYLPLRRVIYKCIDKEICENGVDPCSEMNKTLENLLNSSWKITNNSIVRGYQFNITLVGEEFYEYHEGNLSRVNNLYSVQSFDSGVDVFFKLYN